MRHGVCNPPDATHLLSKMSAVYEHACHLMASQDGRKRCPGSQQDRERTGGYPRCATQVELECLEECRGRNYLPPRVCVQERINEIARWKSAVESTGLR